MRLSRPIDSWGRTNRSARLWRRCSGFAQNVEGGTCSATSSAGFGVADDAVVEGQLPCEALQALGEPRPTKFAYANPKTGCGWYGSSRYLISSSLSFTSNALTASSM